MVLGPAPGASFTCMIAPWLSVRNSAKAVKEREGAIPCEEKSCSRIHQVGRPAQYRLPA